MTEKELFPPTGRNASHVVTLSGDPFAGFDTYEEASAYVNMQREKKRGAGGLAAAATMNWGIQSK